MANEVKVKITADSEELVDGFKKAKKAVGDFAPFVSKQASMSKKEITSFVEAIKQAQPQFRPVTNAARDSFSTIGAEAKKAGDSLKSSFSGDTFSIFKGATLANLATGAFTQVLSSVKQFISGSIAEYEAGEAAARKLAQALRSTGTFSQEAVSEISSYAKQLEITTGLSDKVILSQVAIAKQFGASTAQSKQLVEAAANLSATFGGSLEENVKKLGAALNGQTGKLTKFIPELANLSKEQLAAGEAAILINRKFAGAAENSISAQQRLSVEISQAYEDVQESLGGLIVESSAYNKILTSAKDILGSLSFSIESYKKSQERQKEGFVETADSVNFLSQQYAKLTGEIEAQEAKLAQSSKLIGSDTQTQEILIQRKRAELQALQDQINTASQSVKDPVAEPAANKSATKEELELFKQNAEEKKRILLDLDAFQIEQAATAAEREILSRQTEAGLAESDLEQLIGIEQSKIDAKYLVKEAEVQKIADLENRKLAAELVAQQKAAEQEKVSNDLRVKNKKTADDAMIAAENQKNARMLALAGSAANLLTAILKDGSKEAFLAQKAVAAAEILVADGKARALIPAQTALIPFPANLGAAASLNAYVTAQTALGLGTVAAQTIKGFNSGGLVEGGNIFGDSTVAALTRGEIVAPRKDFDDVVEGTARQRGFIKADEVQQSSGESVSINIQGDVFGEETFIDRLAEKLLEAQRTRNLRLV